LTQPVQRVPQFSRGMTIAVFFSIGPRALEGAAGT
jgi:hypothetical protein